MTRLQQSLLTRPTSRTILEKPLDLEDISTCRRRPNVAENGAEVRSVTDRTLVVQRDLYDQALRLVASHRSSEAAALLIDACELLEECLSIDMTSAWAAKARALLSSLERTLVAVEDRHERLKTPPLCTRHRTPVDMQLRRGPDGEFWGCARFPRCTFTRPLR